MFSASRGTLWGTEAAGDDVGKDGVGLVYVCSQPLMEEERSGSCTDRSSSIMCVPQSYMTVSPLLDELSSSPSPWEENRALGFSSLERWYRFTSFATEEHKVWCIS